MTANNAVTPAAAQFVDPAELKPDQLKSDIERARNELAATLDAIEYKLNVPKQLRFASRRVQRKIEVVRGEHPEALIAGLVGIASAVGLAAWGVYQAVTKD
ncbi:DUF3618 domain-containing protein [Microbacteriaceae bacterium VKM Ac-2855]|nr:DUF3618 domain-containing protein [Microbacteriaceae bacterium VKM Ac-2855]